jgi:uncharacterized membrane protein
MGLASRMMGGLVRHFTTDQAVRAGIITATYAAAASYSRGLLPRTAVQQAAVTGVCATAYYALGTTTWATVSSAAAGTPGSRPGPTARLVAAGVSAAGGKAGEVALRPHSGDTLMTGIAWSELKLLSVAGLAGGLVTVSDLLVHDVLGMRRTPGTTLAVDLGTGALVAGASLARRMHRARRYGDGSAPHKPPHGRPEVSASARARTVAVAGATVAGSAVALAAMATTEQSGARWIGRGLNAATEQDLGEFSDFVGHGIMLTCLAGVGVVGLRRVRHMTQRKSEVMEPAYRDAPTSPYVSCGPTSEIPFEAIGKEGRRFVLMRLPAAEIEEVMGEPAVEPVRVVVPREDTIEHRADLAVRELVATGGFDRGTICIASPTGVGYVNYVMAEALEYLTRGDCAVVVPQYAYVPSALALNKTKEGVALQTAVLEAVQRRVGGMDPARRPRVLQFGESLGAQVAADVAGPLGAPRFDELGLEAGLYLGVPFRSSLWKAWMHDRDAMSTGDRLVNVPKASDLPAGSGRHVMINHHDDPINKFSYSMAVQRPWWFGPPQSRPPMVPRESLFRPVISFVVALVDLLNGMDSKPGHFVLRAHDYRFDMREAVEKAYDLPASSDQRTAIEAALRTRENEWAEMRLIARTGEKALGQLRDTLNAWGEDIVNLQIDDNPGDEASSRLVAYLNTRLGQSGGSGAG